MSGIVTEAQTHGKPLLLCVSVTLWQVHSILQFQTRSIQNWHLVFFISAFKKADIHQYFCELFRLCRQDAEDLSYRVMAMLGLAPSKSLNQDSHVIGGFCEECVFHSSFAESQHSSFQ